MSEPESNLRDSYLRAVERAEQAELRLAESQKHAERLRDALIYHGCHAAHCKATGVVERRLWRGTVNERTLCDCGLAAALAPPEKP